jgi:hypothetical protein
MNPERFVGRPLDSLSLKERWALSGSWVALELYTPEQLPLRIIEALAPTPRECITQLQRRGLDATRFEFSRLPQPYAQ